MLTALVPLKREITVGPVLFLGVRMVFKGIMVPEELRTNMNFMASVSLRKAVSDWSTTL